MSGKWWKESWLGRHRRALGFVLLAVLFIVSGTYIFVNVADIPFGAFNPPEANAFERIILWYPPFSGGIGVANQSIIEVNITANGPIVEGKPVEVSAVGSVSHPLDSQIDNVSIVFEGAYPSLNTSYQIGVLVTSNNLGGVVLYPNNGCPIQPTGITLDTVLCGPPNRIVWPVAGAYRPSLIVWFLNGTSYTQEASSYYVPVISHTVAQEAQYNRVDIAFSWALFFFAAVEGVSIVVELTKRK
ncbi:MAG TPA: hypothetical protein VMS77_02865 [Conexivisphaerales archaeon]|nr:hypothetical protein [Conexivisphaerales archaeon]